MLSDFRLKYILIGRNNKIRTTVPPSTYRFIIIKFRFLKNGVLKNRRRKGTKVVQFVLFFNLQKVSLSQTS